MNTFRIEWWTRHGQSVRSSQTPDNVREILDTLPKGATARIIDERTNSLVPAQVF